MVEDGGQFFISESSGNFCSGRSGCQTDSFRVDADNVRWYKYDPVSDAADVSVVGAAASPAFKDVGFVGFLLQVEGVGQDGGGVNVGARRFVAESKAAPENPPSKTLGFLL